jgi:formylglycine-generating enzyme required for sulfatase activity
LHRILSGSTTCTATLTNGARTGSMRSTIADPRLPTRRVLSPERGTKRVGRGGSFISTIGHDRAAYRDAAEPDMRTYVTGFRVAADFAGFPKD